MRGIETVVDSIGIFISCTGGTIETAKDRDRTDIYGNDMTNFLSKFKVSLHAGLIKAANPLQHHLHPLLLTPSFWQVTRVSDVEIERLASHQTAANNDVEFVEI